MEILSLTHFIVFLDIICNKFITNIHKLQYCIPADIKLPDKMENHPGDLIEDVAKVASKLNGLKMASSDPKMASSDGQRTGPKNKELLNGTGMRSLRFSPRFTVIDSAHRQNV